MKKRSITAVALSALLVLSACGCGKKSSSKTKTKAQKTTIEEKKHEKPTLPEALVSSKTIDIFEGLEVEVESDCLKYPNVYPYPFDQIKINDEDTHYTYDIDYMEESKIISADNDSIKIAIKAVPTYPEDWEEFLEDNNYKVESYTKTIEYKTSDLYSLLLSKEQLTDEFIEDVIEACYNSENYDKLYTGEVPDTNEKVVAVYAILPQEDNIYYEDYDYEDYYYYSYYAYNSKELSSIFWAYKNPNHDGYDLIQAIPICYQGKAEKIDCYRAYSDDNYENPFFADISEIEGKINEEAAKITEKTGFKTDVIKIDIPDDK